MTNELIQFPPRNTFKTNISDRPMLSADAITEAGLDWEVQKEDLFTDRVIKYKPDAYYQKVETHKAIVRQSDNKVLGVVGNRYEPVQNRDAFRFMDGLVENGMMRYHELGSIRGGQRVYILGKIGEFEVVEGDRVEEYLFLYNSHDGSSSLKCIPTTTRIICENMINALLRGRKDGISVRHTANVMVNLDQAQQILAESSQSLKQFREFSKYMARVQMTDNTINDFLLKVFPNPPEGISSKFAENKRNKVFELIEDGYGTDIPGVRGTGWGTFNAITEFVNHHKSTRGQNKEERRFESVIFGGSATIINRAAEELTRIAA